MAPTGKHRPEIDIRQRVNLFMSKLSDRDTETMAAAELDSMARCLTSDGVPIFLSAVGDARSSDKTPLRRHSLRLLSLLAHSLPSSSFLPHLPRILSTALRRIRDPDSSVRAALIEAVRSIASAAPSSALVPSVLRPLAEALFHEQDLNSQSASALSFSAALDASEPNASVSGFLHRLLPRLVKLARSPAFRAKPALLTLLGSAAAAGGIKGDAQGIVSCLAELLASEDWSARKAAADALTRVALAERDCLGLLKLSFLASFDSRRYDKVKIVRDSMNRMIEAWREVSDADLDASQYQSNSLKDVTENSNDGSRSSVTSMNNNSSSIQSSSSFSANKSLKTNSRSPPATAPPIPSSAMKIVHSSFERRPNSGFPKRIESQGKNLDWRIEIAVSDSPKLAENKEKGEKKEEKDRADGLVNGGSPLEVRRVLFEKNCEEKKMDEKPEFRAMPLQGKGSLEATTETPDEIPAEQKDSDLSLIRMQLVQIENQQSNLLELLEKFMASSQEGLKLLEERVCSLETALREISGGGVAAASPAPKACCRLLKLWKRSDNRSSCRLDDHPWNRKKAGIEAGCTNPLAEIDLRSGRTPPCNVLPKDC